MDLFEAVKQSVTARQAAAYYGIRVNRNGMAVCPFHTDKNPSMKVDRRFHCFGCQADGDVIDLVARLYGMTLNEAARKLVIDFSVKYDSREHDSVRKKSVKQQQPLEQRYVQAEKRFFRVQADYLHLLKQWKEEYAPKTMEGMWHLRFIEALKRSTYTEYLLDTLLFGTIAERVAVIVTHGKEVKEIERRISEFIPADAGRFRCGNGCYGSGNDGGGNQRKVGDHTERECEK